MKKLTQILDEAKTKAQKKAVALKVSKQMDKRQVELLGRPYDPKTHRSDAPILDADSRYTTLRKRYGKVRDHLDVSDFGEETVMEQKAANKRRGKVSLAALKNMSPQQRAKALKQAKADAAAKKAGTLKPIKKTPSKKAKSQSAAKPEEQQPVNQLDKLLGKDVKSFLATVPLKYKPTAQQYLADHGDHPAVAAHLKTSEGRSKIFALIQQAYEEAKNKWSMPKIGITATKNKQD